jgi:hypothetical protein
MRQKRHGTMTMRPGLLRCSAAPSPNPPIAPAIRRLRPQRGNPAAKLDASAAIRQKRYDANWGKITTSNKFVTAKRQALAKAKPLLRKRRYLGKWRREPNLIAWLTAL